jgi:hypothetical protein
MLKKYVQFINEEASPRLPKNEEYWLKKGKDGKKVALYTHDDMDGIFSAIEVKKYLQNSGFEIVKYGIINYSEGWKYTTVDPKLINVVVDFANMPGDERDEYIDYYLDHHGSFTEFELDKYKSSPIQKKKTASAYEAICQNLGVPQDELTLSVIDMIDAAKYQEYNVDWSRLLDFNIVDIKKSDNKRLEFAAAFNQFLKRSDHKTLISVIHNCPDASIYSIFNVMKKVYPEHNVFPRSGQKKDFLADSEWRLAQMAKRTRGQNVAKKKYTTLQRFLKDFGRNGTIKLDGYQLIGDLAFIPTGTWANALRARTIISNDFKDGLISEEPKFVLLQYGGTLQVCSYSKIDQMETLPILKTGEPVNDLGAYMTGLLRNFQSHLGYHNPDTSIGQDEITVSGGHGGIGSISNIFGVCEVAPYEGVRFIDMFKNKIITDLSGVNFPLKTKWSEPSEDKSKEPAMDNKVMNVADVTKLDKEGNIVEENFDYQIKDKDGNTKDVTRDEFIQAGYDKAMKPNEMEIDTDNRKIIAKFEKFNNK